MINLLKKFLKKDTDEWNDIAKKFNSNVVIAPKIGI